ncbi:MAG: hypothetical protein JWO48_602 [Bryobacterales bacterium]|nr:hypothetical protein [Bryobacterales bacterium]
MLRGKSFRLVKAETTNREITDRESPQNAYSLHHVCADGPDQGSSGHRNCGLSEKQRVRLILNRARSIIRTFHPL